MPRQLTFDLPAKAALRRGDFLVAPSNVRALDQLEAWRGWPGGMMVLCGAEGAGKSHLAAVWAGETEATTVIAAELERTDIAKLGETAFLAVEDAEEVAGNPAGEQALFHLYNLVHAAGGRLLLTTRRPPARWRLGLPDLESRLMSIPIVYLDRPDDRLLAALLAKLFADRQIAVGDEVIAYLVSRMERSAAAAQALVEALDQASLSEGRPINRRLAALVLDKSGPRGA